MSREPKSPRNQFTAISHRHFQTLSGFDVVRMMGGTHVTIRQMAEANRITLKRVRELRLNGAPSGLAAWEIFFMLREAQLASFPSPR